MYKKKYLFIISNQYMNEYDKYLLINNLITKFFQNTPHSQFFLIKFLFVHIS